MSFVIVEMYITIGMLSLLRTTRANSLVLVSIIGFIGISPPTDIHWQDSLGPIFGVFKKISSHLVCLSHLNTIVCDTSN